MTTQELAKTLGWRLSAHKERVFVQRVWGSGGENTDVRVSSLQGADPLTCV